MKIPVSFDKLKKVVHLADIHVRLFKRHDEYRKCFTTLYEQLRQEDLSEAVIVVVGDICHAKTDMSPEMVVLVSDFLRELSEIAPTLVSAGNHDVNLSNSNRLDSLTPIIKNISTSVNLHYLRNSGIFTVADTDFAVFSILDSPEKWPSAFDCKSENKIALYHGPVHGATTDINYTITNKNNPVSMFDGFDIAMLGDIHKYQVIQRHDPVNKYPVVVYPSSLIQQNQGESIHNHGWCLWDIPSRTHVLKKLPNEYAYLTLHVIDGKVSIPENLPKNIRLRLFTNKAEQSEIKKIVSFLKTKFTIAEISINRTKSGVDKNPDRLNSRVDLIDLTNVNIQNELLKDWVERKYDYDVSEETISKILEINNKMNSEISYEDYSRNISWKPIYLKFSNMFSYGEGNTINFSDMNGLYGIFAQNATGKSSAMEALMFALYDKTPRAFKGSSIMNNRRDSFSCEFKFQINGENFYITREGTRRGNTEVKVNVSFWKETPDGEVQSLNGEDRRNTNSIIRTYIGSYEDFILTAYSSVSSNTLFIDTTQAEGKDLLNQFMGLVILDKLEDAANADSKEVAGILKRFKSYNFGDDLTKVREQLLEKRTEKIKVEEVYAKEKEALEEQYTALSVLQNKKLPAPELSIDVSQLFSDWNKINEAIKEAEEQLSEKNTELTDLENNLGDLVKQLSEYDFGELSEKKKTYDRIITSLSEKETKQSMLGEHLEKLRTMLQTLSSYSFNPNCEVCVENNRSQLDEIRSIEADISTVESDLNSITEDITSLNSQRIALSVDVDKFALVSLQRDAANKLESSIKEKGLDIQTLNLNIERMGSKKNSILENIKLYETNKANIEHNEATDEEIRGVNLKISSLKETIDSMEKSLRQSHSDINLLENNKETILNNINEVSELEDTFRAYKYYMEAMGRNGIPYEIMSRAIPKIESEINAILENIVDFKIMLEVDNKNIFAKIYYDHDRIWPLENSSGMERFISSLAIKIALMNASNLPKPNFMIIDEGLSVLDAEILSAMGEVFNVIRQQFDFAVVISHLDVVRDMVDSIIDITREDGFSYIKC